MSPDAPSADELESHPAVQAAFDAAWADSFPDDDGLRHEEGGFIYFDPASRSLSIRRVPPGGRWALDMSNPPEVPGAYLVATFHTHPTPIARGGDPAPSPDDRYWAEDSGVPWFVISELGVDYVAPSTRVGGLSGPPGYPQ